MGAMALLQRCRTTLASVDELLPSGLNPTGPLQRLADDLDDFLENGMPPQDWRLMRLCNEMLGERVRLQQRVVAWQDATFGEANTLEGLLAKLQEEVGELVDAPMEDKPREAADCLHVLFGIAGKLDMDLLAATELVFQRNQLRKWGKPGADGRIRHLGEGD